MKECAVRKCRSLACLELLQCLIGCHGHHVILCNPSRFIFGDNKNFWYLVATMSNCPWVQGKSNKHPPPPDVCVCWGGGGVEGAGGK